ncbi:HNH endonuclease family protein [Campylobacter sp. LMG 7929]|nr:HNH endonuclease family protein [Campylobacter sp. LMG 7929]HEC1774539.1 DUF1524 domain-containing protein [Campylobacter lari]HEC1790824.1 DUF1524 domain-containing protein [Campylobacter lari]
MQSNTSTSLANLTLISMRKNVQALNYDFAKKRNLYKQRDFNLLYNNSRYNI